MNATSCSGRSWLSERSWSETMPDPQPTPALLLDPDAAKRLRQAELLLDISRKVAAIESLDDVLETLIAITTAEVGAERGTLFLNDSDTGELYSRIALGNFKREIRLLTNTGIDRKSTRLNSSP